MLAPYYRAGDEVYESSGGGDPVPRGGFGDGGSVSVGEDVDSVGDGESVSVADGDSLSVGGGELVASVGDDVGAGWGAGDAVETGD